MFNLVWRFLNLMININPSFDIPPSDPDPLHHFSTRCSYTSNISRSNSYCSYASGVPTVSLMTTTPAKAPSCRTTSATTQRPGGLASTPRRRGNSNNTSTSIMSPDKTVSSYAYSVTSALQNRSSGDNNMLYRPEHRPSSAMEHSLSTSSAPRGNDSTSRGASTASDCPTVIGNVPRMHGNPNQTWFPTLGRIKNKLTWNEAWTSAKKGRVSSDKNDVQDDTNIVKARQPPTEATDNIRSNIDFVVPATTARLQRSKGLISMRNENLVVQPSSASVFLSSMSHSLEDGIVFSRNSFELSPIMEDVDKFTIASMSTFASISDSALRVRGVERTSASTSFDDKLSKESYEEDHEINDGDSLDSSYALASSYFEDSVNVLHYLDGPELGSAATAGHGSAHHEGSSSSNSEPDHGDVPLPCLMLTYPTPELARSPVFSAPSPFPISKFVEAASSTGNPDKTSPRLAITPALSTHGHDGACIFNHLSSAGPATSVADTVYPPTLPRCFHCGFGLSSESGSVPCRMCEKQWLACQMWYHARSHSSEDTMMEASSVLLKQPYVKPGNSNAPRGAIVETLGYPVSSKGLGLVINDVSVKSERNVAVAEDALNHGRPTSRCDEFTVFHQDGAAKAFHGKSGGYHRLSRSWSRLRRKVVSFGVRSGGINTGTVARRKSFWRTVNNIFALGPRRTRGAGAGGVTVIDTGGDSKTVVFSDHDGNRRHGLDGPRPFIPSTLTLVSRVNGPTHSTSEMDWSFIRTRKLTRRHSVL